MPSIPNIKSQISWSIYENHPQESIDSTFKQIKGFDFHSSKVKWFWDLSLSTPHSIGPGAYDKDLLKLFNNEGIKSSFSKADLRDNNEKLVCNKWQTIVDPSKGYIIWSILTY